MLKLALIGAGRWGKNIERTLREMPDIGLLVAADAAGTEKIDLAQIDGVLVATPGSSHVAVAMPFVAAGLPVFIEKPLAANLTEANQLKKAVTEGGLVQAGHIHLHNPAFLAAKKTVKKIGKIRLLHFEGMAPGPVRDDMSVWWDWGPHGVAMALDLLGMPPLAVQAWGSKVLRPQTDLYDLALARLVFPGGVEAICATSWLSPEKRTKLTIVGENGSVVFDDRAEKKVIFYHTDGIVSYPRYSQEPALRAELKQFIRMVKTKQPVSTGIDNGLAVVKLLDAAERSMRAEGRIIRLENRNKENRK